MKMKEVTLGGTRSLTEKGGGSRLDSVKFEMTIQFSGEDSPKEELPKLWAKLHKTLDDQENEIEKRNEKNQPTPIPKTKEEAKSVKHQDQYLNDLRYDDLENIVRNYASDTPEGMGARLLTNQVPQQVESHGFNAGQQKPAQPTMPWDGSGNVDPQTSQDESIKVPSSWISDPKYGPILKSASVKELNWIINEARKAKQETKDAARRILAKRTNN